MGGEAPILIRTKAGKVYAIAGVGTDAQTRHAPNFSWSTSPRPGEILTLDPGGLKGIIPVAGILPALVPEHGGVRVGGAARFRNQIVLRRN